MDLIHFGVTVQTALHLLTGATQKGWGGRAWGVIGPVGCACTTIVASWVIMFQGEECCLCGQK